MFFRARPFRKDDSLSLRKIVTRASPQDVPFPDLRRPHTITLLEFRCSATVRSKLRGFCGFWYKECNDFISAKVTISSTVERREVRKAQIFTPQATI